MNTTQKILTVAIVIAAALHFVGASEHDERNYEVMPEMLVSVPYGAFDPNPNFDDGKTA